MTTHKIQFTFEGEPGFSVDCDEDEDVISAALREGYILLSQCRQGVCSTCKAFLADGEYDDLLPHSIHSLSPSEEDEGFVLLCRLQPRSDMVIEFDYPIDLIGHLAGASAAQGGGNG